MSALRFCGIALNALVLALLGACAGGGGGGGGGAPVITPPPPPPLTPPSFPPLAPPHAPGDFPSPSSAEFNANWAVGGTNAQVAWQNGATGAGVVIGVIDDGIHPDHPELTGRVLATSVDIAPGRDALVTNQSHGSELSSLMVGNYNGQQTVGLAFDAHVLAIRADNGSGGFPDNYLAMAIDYARQQGVDVINLSLGGPSPSSAQVRQAIQAATAAGIIIVVSAGNEGASGATQPSYPAFNAVDLSVSNGLIVVAGGLNSNGSLNTVSSPPGAAQNYYMVAPGWQIIVPDFGPPGPVPGYQQCGLGPNGDLCQIQGTSYASPMIAAAVALIKDGFPGLTPAQVVDLLFTTADDLGPAGTDSLYGRGRLNIGRAFQPVGPLATPLGGVELTPASLVGAAGPAFGDGVQRAGVWSMVGFDAYGRTFPVDLSQRWISAHPGPSALAEAPLLWRNEQAAGGVHVQAALNQSALPQSLRTPIDRAELDQNPMRIDAALAPGLTLSFAAHGARSAYEYDGDSVSHLDWVNSDLSLRLTHRLNDTVSLSLVSESGEVRSPLPFASSSSREGTAARASFDFARGGFDLTLGRIDEEHGLMGLAWNGLFGATPGGETAFAGFGAHVDANEDLRFTLSAELGEARLARSGWLEVVEPLRSSAFLAEARFEPEWLGGALTLSLAQPLRVEDGALAFMAPTATKYGRQSLRFERREFEPTPSGRELRLGLGYSYRRGEALSALGEVLYVEEPGHVAGAEPQTVLRFGVRVAN